MIKFIDCLNCEYHNFNLCMFNGWEKPEILEIIIINHQKYLNCPLEEVNIEKKEK